MQTVLQDRQRPRRSRHEFRYGGLFLCAACGCAVAGDVKKGRYVYYRCSHRRGPCQERYVRQERLEQLLEEQLGENLRLSPGVVRELIRAAQGLDSDKGRLEERRTVLEHRLRDLERRQVALLDLRIGGHLTDEEFVAKKNELARAVALAQEELAGFELPQQDPQTAIDRFIQTCNGLPRVLREGTDAQVRQLLRIVGSNYRYAAGKVDFEPVKPFDLASQVRNRPKWRAEQHDVRAIQRLFPQVSLQDAGQLEDRPPSHPAGHSY